jgi:hypothetical protein
MAAMRLGIAGRLIEKKVRIGASETKRAVARPFLTWSLTFRPGAIGIWSASVEMVMSAVDQPPPK